ALPPGGGEQLLGRFSTLWAIVLAVLMALLIVATVVGNALVMLAFVVDSSLRTQNNYFLLNLAISDFLVGVLNFNSHNS
uniref:G-protein coupled receptors family 1 profile domain-containing protein n=1 Tax=Anolis carolinensis TaxID=28377 RepID=A0A803T4K3_ANOCA